MMFVENCNNRARSLTTIWINDFSDGESSEREGLQRIGVTDFKDMYYCQVQKVTKFDQDLGCGVRHKTR